MVQAAVPKYLGNAFDGCPPGHRYTLYGSFWEPEQGWKRAKNIEPKAHLRPFESFAQEVCALSQALRERQASQAQRLHASRMAVLHARSVAPFVTGTGIEHPLENGMAFLNPYGLPYLPGAGVKGVLRRSAEELEKGLWGDAQGWDEAAVDALFGKQPPPGSEDAAQGALSFWDVIPDCKGLRVEIMNPHYGDYYQGKSTPHDAGSPNPIYFLTVPERSAFAFHVECDPRRLKAAPGLVESWRQLLEAAFAHAFDWLGFGAKTAVGYGQMQRDLELEAKLAEQHRQEEEAAAHEAAQRQRLAGLSAQVAELVKAREAGGWDSDRDALLAGVEAFLDGHPEVEPDACDQIKQLLEGTWSGITTNPDAVQGRKKKPKFNERPRALTKRVLALDESAGR